MSYRFPYHLEEADAPNIDIIPVYGPTSPRIPRNRPRVNDIVTLELVVEDTTQSQPPVPPHDVRPTNGDDRNNANQDDNRGYDVVPSAPPRPIIPLNELGFVAALGMATSIAEVASSFVMLNPEKYRTLDSRIKSFAHWPKSLQCPQSMARSGFVYLNVGDRVACFSCNLMLNSWMPGDCPYIEHAKYLGDDRPCAYIEALFGKSFIEKHRTEYLNKLCGGPDPKTPKITATADVSIIDDDTTTTIATNSTGNEGADPESALTCIVCMDEARRITFWPCGHLATCAICSMAETVCPMCRAVIESRKRTFY